MFSRGYNNGVSGGSGVREKQLSYFTACDVHREEEKETQTFHVVGTIRYGERSDSQLSKTPTATHRRPLPLSKASPHQLSRL